MEARRTLQILAVGIPLMLLVTAVVLVSRASSEESLSPRDPALFGKPGFLFDDPDAEFTLTAAVTEWEVYEGQTVEAWTFNGQYPGPTLRVKKGDKVRVTLVNELPEPTVLHWHGMDVPAHQDGVPGITQAGIQPGESWTYEFVADSAGTTAYHTHYNSLLQLGKGLFGALIIEDPREKQYDHDIVMQLHEIEGLYTINGYSFPKTQEEGLILVKEGETVRLRFINMGSLYHPMHLHGHQMEVLAIDGNMVQKGMRLNTIDVPPGQTIDVVLHADNPGTWVFHCHVLSHVQNKGQYPGGMLAVVHYDGYEFVDHSAGHGGPPAGDNGTDDGHDHGQDDDVEGLVTITSNNSIFDKAVIEAAAGEELTVKFVNNDVNVPHNISFYESSAATNAIIVGEVFSGIETREMTFEVPEAGTYFFRCDIHPTTMVGDFIVR